MKFRNFMILIVGALFMTGFTTNKPLFHVLVIASKAKHHLEMIASARPFLEKMASENNFEVKISDDTSMINDDNLRKYEVFIMLQLAPFDMSASQQSALQRFVEKGKGWVGIHAAGLPGKSFVKPEKVYWQWFEDFMGGVCYSPHPKFQKGTLVIEDKNHPVTKNLPERFEVSDEWYEFDKSPRPNVHVLAVADESTYVQNKPMGDHPIIWINEKFHRMIYVGIGHDAYLCGDKNYKILILNAIRWASEK